MKKLLLLAMALLVAAPAMAGDDKKIDEERLPAKAREFIGLHFDRAKISLVTMDREMFDTTYEVFFTDGSKVEFDRKGEWKEIDCKYGRVPEGAVPEKILTYINAHHAERYVKEIDRDKNDYDVKLDNGVELKFDLKFNFLRFD